MIFFFNFPHSAKSKKIWWLFIPLGRPWGISSVLSSPGFLCWVASCSCLACNAEDLGELQLCPGLSFHGVSMEKTCYWFLKSGRPRERGCGVWDEGEQSDNVPHFCWKYIDASEHSGSPWDAWLLGPVTCMRAMGLSRSMMLSASSPWLLAAL